MLLQQYFAVICIEAHLQRCFAHQRAGKVFGRATILLQLIIHLLLGLRELSDGEHYRERPLVQRMLGLKRLSDVPWV